MPEPTTETTERSRLVGFVVATLIVAIATALGGLVELVAHDAELVFAFAAMIVAFFCGRAPSIYSALLGVTSYNFFFVRPHYTFHIEDPTSFFTLALMLLGGLGVSELTARMREHERAARTEEMRSSLLSAISHDLRTPLATITGAASSVRDDLTLDEATKRDLVQAICEEADRLERLVSNLLEMTRLEARALVPKREWVPIDELVGASLARVEPKLAGRELDVQIAGDVPPARVDPLLFAQVLVNLVENAIKHASGPIDVRVVARAGAIAIEVLDRGPGIQPGEHMRVFEKFFRSGPTRAAGAGLGLAVTKGIVEAHGGTIVARDRDGGGAIFRIELPIEVAPPTEDASA